MHVQSNHRIVHTHVCNYQLNTIEFLNSEIIKNLHLRMNNHDKYFSEKYDLFGKFTILPIYGAGKAL